jgi:hypothetical protein
LFAYGALSIILLFYLIGLGLTDAPVSLVLTLTLVGDVIEALLPSPEKSLSRKIADGPLSGQLLSQPS